MSRGGLAGKWLTAVPSVANAASLSRDKFITNMNVRCGMLPPGLPSKCDGCGAPFSAEHSLKCKDSGLVSLCHDELKCELTDLCEKAFDSSSVRDEPHMNPCCCEEEKADARKANVEARKKGDHDCGDILARGFWTKAHDCIMEVRVIDADDKTNGNCTVKGALKHHENAKKAKCSKPCSK